MITFLIALAILIGGYFFYGKVVERIFGADDAHETPAITKADGVDYVAMPLWKVYMIQFLNIAGLGPIFGAIMGALYGPVAFIWIVFGCLFAGGVHDYFSGMLSVRHGGESIPEVVGRYMGNGFRQFMRVFSVVLLLLVGVVFVLGPAKILGGITGVKAQYLVPLIFVYYLLATMLPIDKLIGRLYPLFGAVLLIMAIGLAGAILFRWAPVPELSAANWANQHAAADTHPLFPMLFITIACGALSGFHSTQSPLMARCLEKESQGRTAFYGAMVAEGIVALIWAAAAMSFFGGVGELNTTMAKEGTNAAWAVSEICKGWLGAVGGLLALLGVVACPITSGDTAFRSARLIIADLLKFEQKVIRNRLLISVPLFVVAFIVSKLKFAVIWRYFGWSNQTLATVVLWAAAVSLLAKGRCHWIASVPATLMTAVCTTYILVAPEGFRLPLGIGATAGIIVAAICLGLFFAFGGKASPDDEADDAENRDSTDFAAEGAHE